MHQDEDSIDHRPRSAEVKLQRFAEVLIQREPGEFWNAEAGRSSTFLRTTVTPKLVELHPDESALLTA